MVSKNIQYLLAYHDCVIIPGFGGLLSNHKSAEISLPEFSIYPPGKNIAFNRMLQTNDGLLIQQLAFSENISYKEAEEKIKSFVKDIDRQLEKSGTYNIEGIGRWFVDEGTQLQFSPNKETVTGTSYLGLPVLALKPVARLKGNINTSAQPLGKEVSPVFTVKALEELVNSSEREVSEATEDNLDKTGWAYWSAAALAVFFVLGSFWINNATKNQLSPLAKGSLFFQTTPAKSNSTKSTNKATTTTKSNTVKPTVVPPKPVEFKKEEQESGVLEAPEAKPTPSATTPSKPTTTNTPSKASAPVSTTPVPATKPSTPVKAKTGKLYIVAGSFGSEKNAQYLQNELSQKGYSGKVIKNPENGMFRVVIETSSSNREADLKKAKQDIAPSVWVLED
jgi:cell division septation protein DedD/nucleoid DNA-binding protein